MAQVDFNLLIGTIKTGIADIAVKTVSNYLEDAKKDGQNLVDKIQENLVRWTQQLADGKLTTSDFEWLVFGQKDVVLMTALKEVGLAEIRIEQFKSSVLNLIVDTTFNLLHI